MGFLLPLLPLQLISLSIADPHFTDAWGWQGHLMICTIAQQYLTENATIAVSDLLGPGGLARKCSWADEGRVRRRYPWSEPLHYANTQNVCNFVYSTDCPNDACVVGAIEDFTWDLRNNYGRVPPPPGDSLDVSLKFLAHFMGDVHQPLHVGFARDRGGVCIAVYWLLRRRPVTTLHKVWDTAIIATALKSFYDNNLDNMINSIVEKYITDKVIDIREPEDYASESITLACDYAYKDVDNGIAVEPCSTLKHEYFCSRLRIVEKRIAQAGVRLAAQLNGIFSHAIGSN